MRASSILAAVVAMLAAGCIRGEPRLLSTSPDGRHRIELQSERFFLDGLIPRGPGQGSDVPGQARLVDAQGHLLRTQRVELLSAIAPSDVTWSERGAYIPTVGWFPFD